MESNEACSTDNFKEYPRNGISPARLIEIINFIFAFLFFFLFPVLFLILYFANKKTINFFIVPRSWRFEETFPQAAWFCHIFWVSRPIFVPAFF